MNDVELNKKFEILKKKFQAGLFEEVISGAKSTLKLREHQVLYNLNLAVQRTHKCLYFHNKRFLHNLFGDL